MKYLYVPNDIAVFFISADFTISDERKILDDLWQIKDECIWWKYRSNKEKFIRAVYNEISKYHFCDDYDEINIILSDVGSEFYLSNSIDEQGAIERYFKTIKLCLTYVDGVDFRKIRLRSLIGKFGYKRRNVVLIEHINKTISTLGLKTFLKGRVPCNIGQVKLDDVVIIRLK